MDRRRVTRVLLLPVICAWAAACGRPVPRFSTENARAHVEMLGGTIGSRPIGSVQNARARQYIVDQLRLYGFEVRVQETDARRPDLGLTAIWSDYYTNTVEPIVFQSSNRHLLDQWVRAAKLPFDADNYLDTVRVSARDVLRYSVVNVNDAAATLGGFPFDNRSRWYTGSDNDLLLNIFVQRVGADPAAVTAMQTAYRTTGVLQRPLITLHTLRDQQVPYVHEPLYTLKTIASGAWLTRHLNIPIDRFEHCNFTQDEALFAFAVMLFYDSVLGEVSGTASALSTAELDAFERRARAVGLPVRRAGERLHFALTP